MRRYTFFFAACIFLVVCYLLYNSLEASNTRRRDYYIKGREELDRLEDKLKQLENELQTNDALINDVRDKIYKVIGGGVAAPPAATERGSKVSTVNNYKADTCPWISQHSVPSGDVQMLDVYDFLPFDNVDGGVWKQGWNIEYNTNSVENEQPRLEVVVIPHSHCDPGWIKTFEKYYQDQTRKILDNMVAKLSAEKQAKFIFAEISFFERWWRDIDDVKRNAVRKILENGQLELVTGAWVMTDEANAHYFAMLDQMIEGHQWLEQQLEYKPRTHWSIDPFGLSSTMPYLLQRTNMTAMVIQRVHYSIKKFLAKNKQLEFMWRQLWAGASDRTDILCHTMPFYSYDVPHTCGPEPKVCCTFDFKRLPGGGLNCPWNEPPVPITQYNVEQRAAALLDQYRKKAQLYKSNVLLIPLGDDFRYDSMAEWDNQFSNYQRLFDFMNSKTQWNVKARFGTLSDYFNEIYARTKTQPGARPTDYPVLSGDFFTYADRDDHYWSGYFTSRPFYKRMDRALQHYLRAAEIAFSLSVGLMSKHQAAGFPFQDIYQHLVAARRDLGLFQHHDGITGTAKDHVVVDYGQKMFQSIEACKSVLAASAHFLISADKATFKTELDTLAFDVDEHMSSHDSLPAKTVIKVSEKPRTVLVYNSLAQERNELICLYSDSPFLSVYDSSEQTIKHQINAVFGWSRKGLELSNTAYEVCFEARVPALGVARYAISSQTKTSQGIHIKLKSNFNLPSDVYNAEKLGEVNFDEESPYYSLTFDAKTGFLIALTAKSGRERSVQFEFVKYGARSKGKGRTKGGDSLSGAYLFLPDGPAQPLTDQNQIVLMSGELMSTVLVKTGHVLHQVRFSKLSGARALDINNQVDITEERNFELAMRIKTDIDNKQVFFTDLNGLQMLKRKHQQKLPLQANIYPMSSAAFIQDDAHRLTVLSAQPLGAGSLENGWLEILLDRRLMQDDDRGLFQGVTDNKLTPDHFKLLLEPLAPKYAHAKEAKIGYHTPGAHSASLSLLYPLVSLYAKELDASAALASQYVALSSPVPCDVHIVNVRTLQEPHNYSTGETRRKAKRQQAIILHRLVSDCTELQPSCTANGEISLDMFDGLGVGRVENCSLTLMHCSALSAPAVQLEQMSLNSFKVTLG